MYLVDYAVMATGFILLVAFTSFTVSVWEMVFKDWKKD